MLESIVVLYNLKNILVIVRVTDREDNDDNGDNLGEEENGQDADDVKPLVLE